MVSWIAVQNSRAVSALGLELYEGAHSSIEFARIHVKFKRGRTYVYDVGNRAYFDRFVGAPSKGRYYVFVIKARFDYVRKY